MRGSALVGFQITSSSNHASRRSKILDSTDAVRWLNTGSKICVISWHKYSKAKARLYWRPRVEWITLEDFEPAIIDLVDRREGVE
jgi:hypothetical protein